MNINNPLYRFMAGLVRGEIDFATSFWIHALFIPIAAFCFVGLVMLDFLSEGMLYVVTSAICLYAVVAWIGAWRASRTYQGPVEFKFLFMVVFVAVMLLAVTEVYTQDDEAEDTELAVLTETDGTIPDEGFEFDAGCTAVGISLHGGIVTYIPEHAEGDSYFDYDVTSSDYVDYFITKANEDPNIKGILIEVDSGGGSPVAGEEMANAVKRSQKPVVAYIRDVGASAAYMAVSSADKIFASRNSDVGSIGVTMSYLSEVQNNIDNGYNYVELNTGKFKDAGDPDKPLTAEERALFMRDLKIIHTNFVQMVAENRNLSIEELEKIADGSSVLGDKAKELGLIDEIGGRAEAEMLLGTMMGIESEACFY